MLSKEENKHSCHVVFQYSWSMAYDGLVYIPAPDYDELLLLSISLIFFQIQLDFFDII
jgi:hypothetical protein